MPFLMGSHIVPLHLLLVLLVFTFLRQRQKGFFDIKCFPRDPKWNLNSRIGKIIRTKSQSGKAQQQRKETRAFFSDGKVLLPTYPMKREILEHDKVPRNGVQWKNQVLQQFSDSHPTHALNYSYPLLPPDGVVTQFQPNAFWLNIQPKHVICDISIKMYPFELHFFDHGWVFTSHCNMVQKNQDNVKTDAPWRRTCRPINK